MLTLRAAIQEKPPDHQGGYVLQRKEIEATDIDFEQANQALKDQVAAEHPGWRIMWVAVGPKEKQDA